MKKINLLLIFLTLLSAFFHFYHLNWGAPFYFHPDERNIASAVTQLSFPLQMNPHFFAYGSFPIYMAYFLGIFINKFQSNQVMFDQAIIATRIISAILATALIPTLFLIGKKINNNSTGIIAAILGTFSIGIIQFAHFGTVEMWQAFLSLLFFYCCIRYYKNDTIKKVLLCGIIFGLLIGTKISSAPLVSLFFLTLLFSLFQKKLSFRKKIFTYLFLLLVFLLTTCIIYFITNPFIFFDTASFLNSIHYESSVALGTLPVFYTGEFFHTIPILFQFIFVYPFLLNPLITALFIPCFLFVFYQGLRTKNIPYLLLCITYLLLFIPAAFLFTKWTRYILPTLPFMYLLIAITISEMSKHVVRSTYYVASILIGISFIFSLSYFVTVFLQPDSRMQAALWASQNIIKTQTISSEVYDLGILPFNSVFSNIKLFDFYAIDTDPHAQTPQEFIQSTNSQYIILPSQRILKTRLLNANNFLKGHVFYENLINGNLRFTKIYETPCDMWCKIVYFNNPIFSFEETASVFDRPEIIIFKYEN